MLSIDMGNFRATLFYYLRIARAVDPLYDRIGGTGLP